MIKHHIPLIGAVILLTAALSASLWAYAQPAATPTVVFRGRVYYSRATTDWDFSRPSQELYIRYQGSSLIPSAAELTANSAALQGSSLLVPYINDYYDSFPSFPNILMAGDFLKQRMSFLHPADYTYDASTFINGQCYFGFLCLEPASKEIMKHYNFYPIKTRMINYSENPNDIIGTLATRYHGEFPLNGTNVRDFVGCSLYASDHATGIIIQLQDGSYGYMRKSVMGGSDPLITYFHANRGLLFQGQRYQANSIYIYTDNEFAQLQRDGIFLTTPAEERTVASSWKVYDGLTVYQSERFSGVIAIEADWPDGSKRYIYCKTSN